jgi:peptide-methionine (R)-S-oxide reductase
MPALHRFLPVVTAAVTIAIAAAVSFAADDDGPTVPRGARTAQRQKTPPKGQPLFGTNPGAKSPMPADDEADRLGEEGTDALGEPLPKTLQEWKSRLTAEQFQITRMKGTERAFTGKYWKTDTPGTYKCVCCGEPLFTSGDKFLSECGWPAFSAPIDKKANGKVAETPDFSFGMRRVEVTCRKCGAHLGHVFNDGPPPTGIRYCINSASIVLEEAKPGEGDEAGTGPGPKPGK